MPPVPLHPIVASLPATVPFVGPEAIERRTGVPFRARMGANESPFGPAPSVIAALTAATSAVGFYGDPELYDLRVAIGEHLDVPPATIIVGEGIDGIFATLCRLVIDRGDVVVASLGAYPTFLYHAAAQGARIETVPYRNCSNDLAGLAARARATAARIVFLANPDNPTGAVHDAEAVMTFIDAVPDTTLVVLDEAYAEFAPAGTLPPHDYVRPNLIRTRTFSKAHGLAGLRVGYAFGDPGLIAAFDRIRNHFGVNRLAQITALAALRDPEWTDAVVGKTRAGLAEIATIARNNVLAPLPTATNFVAIDCGSVGLADAILDGLADRAVFIRKPRVVGLDHLIRVSVGRPDEIALFGSALAETLETLR